MNSTVTVPREPTPEMLPCPFCGGSEIGHGYSWPPEKGIAQCFSDGCEAYLVANNEMEAIAAWNRRAAPPVEDEIAALRAQIADCMARHAVTERDACMWAERTERAEKQLAEAHAKIARLCGTLEYIEEQARAAHPGALSVVACNAKAAIDDAWQATVSAALVTLSADHRALCQENASLRAEVERLKSGLAPFAAYAANMMPGTVNWIPDAYPLVASPASSDFLTAGDIRRARALLDQEKS